MNSVATPFFRNGFVPEKGFADGFIVYEKSVVILFSKDQAELVS